MNRAVVPGAGGEALHLERLEVVPESLPSAGDLKLALGFESSDFSGRATAWFFHDTWKRFVGELRELASSRSDSACLASMSPGEALLQFATGDRGALVLTGTVSSRSPHQRELRFSFEIEGEHVAELVRRLEALSNND